MTDQEPDADLEEAREALSRMPALERKAFFCPRCGAFADQTWQVLYVRVGGNSIPASDSRPDQQKVGGQIVNVPVGKWSTSKCRSCQESSVWREDRMIYPAGSTVAPPSHADMPPEARELYDEAREVVSISRRAGAALARASLERLLKTVDPVTGRPTLEDRIERILPRVSDGLADMLTVIRHAGNKSLHVEDQPDEVMVLVLDPEETEIVEMIFTAVNNAVEELITRPQKTSGLFSKVPEAVRKKVEAAKAAKAAKGDES